ncbi:hypothetical protein DUI87_22204 [Hirundo rustica rustica]|uniref:Uncharacterized protein n=1 Tax=Hirundo rustica rustica TaxID=333673 RepID=A0A3M0JKN3_HIRRU|nr:hypothetical protein DUI87_22204 [Hirundo rustica rustica]
MEEDKANPNSRSPRPFSGLRRAQALHEQQKEAKRGSIGARRGRRGALDGDLLFVRFDIEEEGEFSQGEINKCQQGTPGEACAEPQLTPGDAQSSQELSDWDEGLEQDLCQEESRSYWDLSDWEERSDQEPSQAEARRSPAVSDWEECREQESSQGDIKNYQEYSDWEESLEQCLSPGEGTSRWTLSEMDAYRKQKLSQIEARSQREVSYWEESMDQGLFQGELGSSTEMSDWEESIRQEGSKCKAKRRRLSVQSSWEDDSIVSTIPKAWLWEDNDWDEVSILDLCKKGEEARLQRLAAFARDRLPVPVPREAWVEHQALGPCSQKQLCARPAPLKARVPMGHASSPGQPVPHKQGRSLFRRAMRRLCCCCLAAQPED